MEKMEKTIIEQVNKVFEGADERNWKKVATAMDSHVMLDYSSMTGSPATLLTPQEITSAWAAFLPGFDRTNHKLSDFKVQVKNSEATVTYQGSADHFYNSKVWTVEGSYTTKLKLINENWLVTAQTFHFKHQIGDTTLPTEASNKMQRSVLTEKNRRIVDSFFIALETQKLEMLKEVFAENGKQLNPYSPQGFPKSFDGAEGIYKQYSGLTENFGQMKFPRQIFATEDPNFFLVKFQGEIEIKTGGKYENDYIGTFKLENGKVIEYTEYFNQVVMAKSFNIDLK
jgi:ketosteroid isomerase-like protein